MQPDFLASIETDEPPLEIKKKTIGVKQNVEKRQKRARGGYRPVLVDETGLSQEAKELETPMQRLLNEHKHLSSQDKVAYYLIVYLNQRYPNQLLQNYDPIVKSTLSDLEPSVNLNKIGLEFKNKSLVEKKLSQWRAETLFDVINNFNLHSVPYSARYALANWYCKSSKYHNLVLFVNEIPTSRQVLEMQAKRARCVTLICDRLDQLVMDERDPLSFLLHDLVHAHKMYNSDYLLQGQVGFCRAILKVFDSEQANDILASLDDQFHQEFDYLISDMNSHPKHLFYYLKAVLITAFRRKFDAQENLTGESLTEFNKLFELVIDQFGMNEQEKSLSRRLIFEVNSRNTQTSVESFNLIDFTLLDQFFLNLAQ